MLRSLRNHTQSGSQKFDAQKSVQCARTIKANDEFKNSVERFLWGSGTQNSTHVETIEKHAEKAIRSVNSEDPRKAYILSKEIDGVRLYERIPSSEDEILKMTTTRHFDMNAKAGNQGQVTGRNREVENIEPNVLRCYEKEYRGCTRIPGSIETVVEILSTADVREQYWISMHTIKGFASTKICGHSRLNKDPREALPRMNLKYLASQFSKNTRDIFEVCYAEYARYDVPEKAVSLQASTIPAPRETLRHAKEEVIESSISFGESDKTISNVSSVENSPVSSVHQTQDVERSRNKNRALLMDDLVHPSLVDSGHSSNSERRTKLLRKAYVYRRSIDEKQLHLQEARARITMRKKNKPQQSCLMYYIRDWLYKIEETSNANVCKVILTCRVYIPEIRPISSHLLSLEFFDFFAHQMASLRVVLSKQWKEQIREAGLDPSVSAASMIRNQFRRKSTGASKSQICAICLTSFSMLRRKIRCITCTSFICQKCCVRKTSAMLMLKNDPYTNSMRYNFAERITFFPRNHATNDLSYLDDDNVLENKQLSGGSARGSFRECILCDLFGPSSASDAASRISSSVRMQFTPRHTQTGDLHESSRTSANRCSRDSCLAPQDMLARGSTRSTSYPITEASARHDCEAGIRDRTRTMGDLVVGIRRYQTAAEATPTAMVKDGKLQSSQLGPRIVLLAEKEAAILKTCAAVKRSTRAQSEDWKYSSAHHKYSEKDLANFNLKLL